MMLSMSEREDEIWGACVALERGRRVIGNAKDTVLAISGFCELCLPLAGHPFMPVALERVATLPLVAENRVLRMRLIGNLANSEENKAAIFEWSSLMEATMKVATLDKAESARVYSSAVLMDLSSCPYN